MRTHSEKLGGVSCQMRKEDKLKLFRPVDKIPEKIACYKGKKLGRLLLKEFGYIFENGKNKGYWLCDCDCGNKNLLFWGSDIYRGKTVGCGCYKRDVNRKRLTKHNLSRTPIYKRWKSMMERCYTKGHSTYKDYGAKGIKVCERWHTFENFYEDMYESFKEACLKYGEENVSLDRINPVGDYEPSNCRWTNWETQYRNRTTNKYFVATSPDGDTYIHNVIKDFAIEHNLSRSGISACLRGVQKTHKGWTFRYATEEEIESFLSVNKCK